MNSSRSACCHDRWTGFVLGLLMSLLSLPLALDSGLAQNFLLRTEAAGLAAVTGANGVALADYDRDGDLDIYIVSKTIYSQNNPETWNRLFSNNGNGTFIDVTTTAGLAGRNANPNQNPNGMGNKLGASWGDYDNDGWADLFLTHYGPDQLFHNNGDGTFTDVTALSGISTRRNQLSSSALWFDYDRDGDLDLYISIFAEYFTQPSDRKNKLYENLGDGSFTDVSAASGTADEGQTWTTVAIDANHDGYLDLYLANDFGPNKFYLNNGNKTFQEKTADYGLVDNYHGMGLAIADCDGNGYFDIYLTNETEVGPSPETNPLFLNTGQNSFVNSATTLGVSLAGWGWGAEFFDLENDGDEDLIVTTNNFQRKFPRVLFRNDSESGGAHFEKITQQVGLNDSTVSRCVAVFDYDNDGDSDLLISNFYEAPSLYQNPMAHGNWLDIKLEGTASNRDGFGAVVEVSANGKSRKKYHHGAQFLGQNIQPLHFGVSDAQSIEKITVYWPNGMIDEIDDAINVNQKILIKEGSGIVSAVLQPPARPTALPEALRLGGNYPNPFNGSTLIRFEINIPGEVEVKIINLRGQAVKVLHKSFSSLGEKTISWDGTDLDGQSVSSGIYFYHLKINNVVGSRGVGKMLYLK